MNFNRIVFIFIIILYSVLSLKVLQTELLNGMWGTDALSEWLVNYQAGIVRRGFAGEVLFQINSSFDLRPEMLIKSISTISILWLSVIFLKTLKRVGIPLFYAALPIIGVSIFYFHPHFSGLRKDPLLLLIAYYSIYHLYNYQKNKKLSSLLYWQALLILGIFLHEAFLFYGALIQLLIYFFTDPINAQNGWIKKSVSLTPLLGSNLINFLNKGDKTIADSIFDSWRPYLQSQYGADVSIEKMLSIRALGWDTLETAKFHLDLNFFNTDNFGIPGIFFFLLIFVVIIYVFANCNFKYPKLSQQENFEIFITIWLTVFMMMLPLFTVLSCDYLRLFAYLNLTTIFIYDKFSGIIAKNTGVLNALRPFSNRISATVYNPRYKWIFHKGIYIFTIFFFLTYSPAGIKLDEAFKVSIAGRFYQKAIRAWEIYSH